MQVNDAAGELRPPGRLVDRKVQRRVHHIAQRVGQLLGGHPEPDCVQAAIALPQPQAAVPPFRYRVYAVHHGTLQQEHRGGVLRSVGCQLVQMPHAFHRDTIQMDGYITGKRRGVQHRALPGSPLVQAAAQLGQVFFPDGKSRRHGVTAVAHQKVGTGADAGVQVEALHTAPAALALAVLVDGDHDDRASGAFHQPGRHDADDAGMPVPSPQQHDAVIQPLGLLFQQLFGSFEDLLLGLLPVGVDLVQFVRQFLGSVRVLTEHQLQSGNGVIHAACRIDAGRDGVADILGSDGLARKADFL